jgi:hypothetical protein
VNGVQVAALVVALNPALHAAQTRLLLDVACTITYWPGLQTVYAAHTLSLSVVPEVTR